MAQYLSSLRDILVMRRKGQFHQVIFDTYNEMLAALPDSKVTEMYKNFMLIYLEEADDATLEFMTLGQNDVDDNVLGFAEMMTIKLGEMMDQPRHVRMAAIANEKQRKLEQEKARQEKEERDRKNYAKMAALREEIATLYASAMPAIEAISKGEGEIEVTEQRRLQRKAELQLLLKTSAELKSLSNYQWQAMSTSGLRREEVACLIHVLSKKGAPAQSATFLQLLEQKFANMPRDGEEAPPPPKPVPLPKGGRPPARMRALTGMAEREAQGLQMPAVDVFEVPDVPSGGRLDLQASNSSRGSSGRVSFAGDHGSGGACDVSDPMSSSRRSSASSPLSPPPIPGGMRFPAPPPPISPRKSGSTPAMPPPIPPVGGMAPPPIPPTKTMPPPIPGSNPVGPPPIPGANTMAPPPIPPRVVPPVAPPPPPMAPPPVPPMAPPPCRPSLAAAGAANRMCRPTRRLDKRPAPARTFSRRSRRSERQGRSARRRSSAARSRSPTREGEGEGAARKRRRAARCRRRVRWERCPSRRCKRARAITRSFERTVRCV